MTPGHKKANLWYKYYDTFIFKCGWKVNIPGNYMGRYYFANISVVLRKIYYLIKNECYGQ